MLSKVRPVRFQSRDKWLAEQKAAGRYRRTRVVGSRNGTAITVDGQSAVNFCSNDYLGLAAHPRIIRAVKRGLDEYGLGSGASQMVCGKFHVHSMLEERLAGITARDDAILFSSGYLANLAAVSALAPSREDQIFLDRLCHGSLVDGALSAKGGLRRYRHADPASLAVFLNEGSEASKLVVTDAVFSMDGDLAPLPQLATVCDQSGALFFVDDAHGFGVLGNAGRGSLEHFALDQRAVPLMMATFGKALGAQGAFIAGQKTLIDTIRQRARPYIYTTALPPPVAAGVLEAVQILEDEPERRDHLHELIDRFRRGAGQRGLPLKDSTTAIQPLVIGGDDAAVAFSNKLLGEGYYVAAIRPPTVPANTARLRITLSAAHTLKQVDGLLDALSKPDLWSGV